MKKLLTSCLLVTVTLGLFASNPFRINGSFSKKISGNVQLTLRVQKNNKYEFIKFNTIAVKGRFTLSGKIEEPQMAQLKFDSNEEIWFYIEPSVMNIYIPNENKKTFTLKGSKTQQESELYKKSTSPLIMKSDALWAEHRRIEKILDSLKNDNPNYSALSKQDKQIISTCDSINVDLFNRDINFIKSHPNSYLPVLTAMLETNISQGRLSLDSGRILFNSLSEKVRNSTLGRQTDKYIRNKENILVGKVATDFQTLDSEGKEVILSSFKDKSYVLLDFWASWCGPCLKGMPHVKRLFEQYHSKGFEVICISVDRDKTEWLEAIGKHQLEGFKHILTYGFEKMMKGMVNEEDIDEKYPTDSVPKYILIDKAGKIIGKWEGYSEDNEKEQDQLLEGIFGK
jgi:peroxiredoxin